ncbi:hypothetical protein EMIT047CA2_70205 [Pseudomonas soli]
MLAGLQVAAGVDTEGVFFLPAELNALCHQIRRLVRIQLRGGCAVARRFHGRRCTARQQQRHGDRQNCSHVPSSGQKKKVTLALPGHECGVSQITTITRGDFWSYLQNITLGESPLPFIAAAIKSCATKNQTDRLVSQEVPRKPLRIKDL